MAAQRGSLSQGAAVTDHTKHLNSTELDRYNAKLAIVGCDPYTAPGVLFTPLASNDVRLPNLDFSDIMIYLVESPSAYTMETVKAHKSKDSYKFFRAGWVNDAKTWYLKAKKMHIITARVSKQAYQNLGHIFFSLCFSHSQSHCHSDNPLIVV